MIDSATINGSGHLILGMDNGETMDCGDVTGEDGVHAVGASIIDGHLIIALSNGGTHDCGALPVGPAGADGEDGIGTPGLDGKSAYEIAVDLGFVGTVEEWILSLKGEDGVDGIPGQDGVDGSVGGTGATGSAATISVGTVTGLAAGASPTVANAGTSSAAVLNFGIPAGATGATGAAGTSVTKFSVTVAIVPGLVALGTASYAVTATGILSTDDITVQPTSALPANLILAHWRVTGNNAVTITLGTPILLGLNLGANSYNFRITAIR